MKKIEYLQEIILRVRKKNRIIIMNLSKEKKNGRFILLDDYWG